MKLVEIGLKPVEAFYLYWFSSLTYLVMKIKIISGQSANGDLSLLRLVRVLIGSQRLN